IKTSPDGLTWTARTFAPAVDGITRSALQFVVVGDDGAMGVSANGITWRNLTRKQFDDVYFRGVAAGGGHIVFTTDLGAIRRSLYV
ncbi:MAG TPA: hypothetical protein VK524_34445, partial [Polyangiaceae bacterium]|nr:hypothetical protein [Polyangiaceae bacterium]